ncbi:MAG: sigma-70 family RNA polymerase sigma factor [Clostridia bacterium]|nr:sigma-70 family RNA polymerase sigma factor [Clostridia bacterium]
MTNQEFNIVVEKLRPKLLNFANGFVKHGAATADDMVQEAVLKLWNSKNLDDVRNPEALTIQILKNVCIDYLRLKKNSNEELKPNYNAASEYDPFKTLERKDQFRNIQNYLAELPSDQMMAVRLRDIMGYEMTEIALILGTTEVNVRTLLSRARQKLRERLLQKN